MYEFLVGWLIGSRAAIKLPSLKSVVKFMVVTTIVGATAVYFFEERFERFFGCHVSSANCDLLASLPTTLAWTFGATVVLILLLVAFLFLLNEPDPPQRRQGRD